MFTQETSVNVSLATYKTFNMDSLKTLQWNCRGTENKIYEMFFLLTDEINDIFFKNEVKKMQKTFRT